MEPDPQTHVLKWQGEAVDAEDDDAYDQESGPEDDAEIPGGEVRGRDIPVANDVDGGREVAGAAPTASRPPIVDEDVYDQTKYPDAQPRSPEALPDADPSLVVGGGDAAAPAAGGGVL